VSPATAVGLDVVVWVVNRRVDVAPWLATGAIGFFSDDPLYLSGRSPMLASDRFAQCTYYYCHLASSIAGDRGTFSAPDTWGYAYIKPGLSGPRSGAGAALSNARDRWLRPRVHRPHLRGSNPRRLSRTFICAAGDRSFDDTG
jgi:hypothetical protein